MTLQNEVVQKINGLCGVKEKVFHPILACVAATCISGQKATCLLQTKINQPA